MRFGWYARASGSALLRHWQWLLIVALLVPGVPIVSLLSAPAPFLLAVVSPGLSLPIRLGEIAVLSLLAVAWILPQRENVMGGKFAAYTAALPIQPLTRLAVDLTMLLVADIVPLLFFIMAATHASVESGIWLAMLVAILLAAQLWVLCHLRASPIFRWPLAERVRSALPPWLSVQFQALSERPGASLLRVGIAFAIGVAADRLIVAFAFDARSVPMSIVAADLICLVLSGFYRGLLDAHRGAGRFLAALPLPPNYWTVRDVAFVATSAAPPLAIGWFRLFSLGLLSPQMLLLLVLACAGLIALLRIPLTRGGRLGSLAAAVIAALWAGAAIAAASR